MLNTSFTVKLKRRKDFEENQSVQRQFGIKVRGDSAKTSRNVYGCYSRSGHFRSHLVPHGMVGGVQNVILHRVHLPANATGFAHRRCVENQRKQTEVDTYNTPELTL